MEPDFSGWATKNGLKCSDGRTIMQDAFKHQDQARVPLVWQHDHNDPENVLGHVLLENRAEGVYAYGFFNDSQRAQHAKGLVVHKDINMMSIWANQLVERSKAVLHGAIREVSLVLAGANPGAVIENITISHGDGMEQELDDEVIIKTGLELVLGHGEEFDVEDDLEHADGDGPTVQDVYDSMNEEQKNVLHFMIGEALDSVKQSDGNDGLKHALGPDATVNDIYESMNEEQQNVLHFLIGEAIDSAAHSDINDNADSGTQEGNNIMKHNVFEGQGSADTGGSILSHDDMKAIASDAASYGSFKRAVDAYALAHNITDIDTLFPDAKNISNTPEFLARRVEWVSAFLGAAKKSPFARIKTLSADITEDDARAKGYITGTLKKEEFFSVSKRTTVPTTVYKKQKLDRDDVIDIADFDVVTWLKAEMRIMLDEEIARAALIGDGRDVSSEDKIDEQCIRPIATDSELYTTKVNVNLDDASSSVQELIDAVVANRHKYKGTGMPTFFTSETIIAKFLLLKDTLGRRIYKSLDEIATELRCAAIVPVEVMEEDPSLVGVIVNPVDYSFGTDRGGEVTMFDDFDIDYNQMKYLIETRTSGALTKMKSAIAIFKVASTDVLVTPVAPTFNEVTGVLSITNTTGVVYKNGATVVNAAGSPYAAIAAGASVTIDATPSTGYYFADSDVDSWTFTRDA